MTYIVPPGLYAVGVPGRDDPVIVTANYKMSYDIVRHALVGRNVWLLVLETFGINVWCAAGKGTFGTEELVQRVKGVGLDKVVAHRRLLLPVLGAPGVSAHEVAQQTGFTVRYTTIRAADLPAYLDNRMEAKPAMRELTFSFRERLGLVPIELVMALKPMLILGALVFAAGAVLAGPPVGLIYLFGLIGAALTGTVVGPLFLPWLPTRSFAVKGAVAGIAWTVIWSFVAGCTGSAGCVAAFFSLPAISAFFTLNFTGSTPFTSKSGVKKEMKFAIPAIGCALFAAAVLLFAAQFF